LARLHSRQSLKSTLFALILFVQAIPVIIHGVEVHSQYDAIAFFPFSWRVEPISCTGTQVDLREAQRIYPLIEDFASDFSSDVLADNLRDIYLLDELECYGSSYGGTNSRTAVYITVGSLGEGYTNEYLYSILHEEFSSILMRNYPFPEAEWALVNENDFAYSENAVEVVDQDGITRQTHELLEGGFLLQYSTTSLENDFNQFAGWLFSQETELCELRRQYRRIEKKAVLAINFYHSIDSAIRFSQCE
jgi:hypothetical protein